MATTPADDGKWEERRDASPVSPSSIALLVADPLSCRQPLALGAQNRAWCCVKKIIVEPCVWDGSAELSLSECLCRVDAAPIVAAAAAADPLLQVSRMRHACPAWGAAFQGCAQRSQSLHGGLGVQPHRSGVSAPQCGFIPPFWMAPCHPWPDDEAWLAGVGPHLKAWLRGSCASKPSPPSRFHHPKQFPAKKVHGQCSLGVPSHPSPSTHHPSTPPISEPSVSPIVFPPRIPCLSCFTIIIFH